MFTKSGRERCSAAMTVASSPVPSSPVACGGVSAPMVAAAVMSAALVITAGSLLAPTAALAGPDGLASVVLADTLPGLVANPPGPTNGPINKSNVGLFGGNGGGTAGLAQHLADADVSGELRFWVHDPPNGDGVVISAFQFKDPKQVGAFLVGLNSGYGRVASGTFSVPGILGGSGYTVHVSASGAPSMAYIVTFAKGSIDFEVQVITASGDLTKTDARSVATRQAANAPGGLHVPITPAGPSWPFRAGEIVGYVLLGIIVVALVLLVARLVAPRSRTTRRPVVTPAWHAFPPQVAVPERPPAPPREVGWHPDPDHLSEQTYWDGRSWTARRRWIGATWVEDADEPDRDGGPPG